MLMELLKDFINKVYFEGESNWGVTAMWAKDDVIQGTIPTEYLPATSEKRWVATLPYFNEEQTISLIWNYVVPGSGSFSTTDKIEIVTPYLSLRELKKLETDLKDDELIALEAQVRHLISAHTGQTFGHKTATYEVRGSGEGYLALPARLIEATSFNGTTYNPAYYEITGDGWYLGVNWWGVPGVKADFYGLHRINGIIENPDGINPRSFLTHRLYSIAGEWGWESIPSGVKEAAKILVEQYACEDSVYRDRYLVSMTAADWRIQFSSGAYSNTGNVRADQLLNNYVLRRGWAVI